jgi:hypothetical protein
LSYFSVAAFAFGVAAGAAGAPVTAAGDQALTDVPPVTLFWVAALKKL